MKTKLKDIKLFSLDGQTVLQISKLVRRARASEDLPLRLNDPLIVAKALNYASTAKDKETSQLYTSIVRSLKELHGLDLDQSNIGQASTAPDSVAVA